MRILIVGAGATGGYFGAHLAQAGRDVTFLVREQRKQQLEQQGLRVKSPLGDFSLTPKLLLASELSTPFDLIIVTVKSFALSQAMADIAPAVGAQTLIMPVLNGMRHIDILRQRFGAEKIIGGYCKIHATLGAAGEIVQMGTLHQLFYGDLHGENGARQQAVDAALRNCGFDAILTSTLMSELWEKWLLLGTLGAVTCLSRGNTQQILQTAGGEALLRALFQELLTVMRAEGYQERPAITTQLYHYLNNPATPMTSSMYRDLMQGYTIEADHIIGDLLVRAARHALSLPLLNAVYVNLCVYQQSR